jgi:hypothetical protein
MSDYIELHFRRRIYDVPKKMIRNLLAAQKNGDTLTAYSVQAFVPVRLFEEFLGWLEIERTPEVTKANEDELRVLAAEFHLPDLEAKCAALSRGDDDCLVPVQSDIEVRVADRDLQSRARFSEFERLLEAAKMRLLRERLEVACGTPRDCLPMWKYLIGAIDCPSGRGARGPLNGIIAYLSRRHAGSLHTSAVVTVISSSVCNGDPQCAAEHVLDFDGTESFRSEDSPDQWICWVFHFREVVVREYTIVTSGLQSWLLEGSGDARNWSVIDRRTNWEGFQGGLTPVSFPVADEVRCRYIRLTQTGPTSDDRECYRLSLREVEFFGTIFESQYA